jgi:hypothetical protein
MVARGIGGSDFNIAWRLDVLKNLTVEQVEEITNTAEALNAKHPSSDLRISTSKEIISYMDDRRLLVDKISSLSHDARMELMALMWIGHDSDRTFSDALKYAYKYSDGGDIGYLACKSLSLPGYFRKGLERLRKGQEISN